jgi:hypothetical protein
VELRNSKRPSRVIVCNGGSVEELSVEAVGKGKIVAIFEYMTEESLCRYKQGWSKICSLYYHANCIF